MLHLRYNTEDWREQITGWIADDLDEVDTDRLADQLCEDTLRRLSDAGIEYQRAYSQSVGFGAILQAGGTDAEREAFEGAINDAIEEMRKAHA